MRLTSQKRLAAQIFKRSVKKIKIDPTRLEDVKESITKADIRALIIDNVISARPVCRSSRGRIQKNKAQKRKGRQSGKGSRKGVKGARLARKTRWIYKIRKQRNFLKNLREKKILDPKKFRDLYLKAKGGFFRSKEHLKLFMNERGYVNKK